MEQKFALVTGASRGIGKAIAITLAKAGYNIVLHFNKNQDAAMATAKEIEEAGKIPYIIQADITKDIEVESMFLSIGKFTDRIDVLVNNAGAYIPKMIAEMSMLEVRYMADIILLSKISVTKQSLPFLKKSKAGCIVNIASVYGMEETAKQAGAYSAAEAGVVKFTKCCALEFSEFKIRANCIAPGIVDTDMTRESDTKEVIEGYAKANPSGRIGQPQDIANLVKYLVSEEAGYVNGETIGVNGGSNLG
jgi:3-oxoacyl-[acyl-carrier protein] reductase